MFFKKADYDFLTVCLGNPGEEYRKTRHNAGFLFAEWMEEYKDLKIKRLKFRALYGEIKLSGKKGLVILPQTYMNESGVAVKGYASAYGIKPENIIVVVDDINFPVGQMRIKRKGSSAGHNGMKSIIEHLGSEDFPRIKIGVSPKHEGQDLRDYVLSDFSKADIETLDKLYESVYDAVCLTVEGNIDLAMQKYN
ncbi:MAG: aminoacyl-tRNA hydrolase [Clostridia bacterium]|nr:aminoacyl-tRNA hydrolase [Clostridia bacterium]